MATVPIPWFTGAPVGGVSPYFGKAFRQQRQLHAVAGLMSDVGTFLRKERSKGLPPGTTDEDLVAQEQKLEAELGDAQDTAVDQSTHGVERAHKQGDPQKARDVAGDPAGYASATHEEDQGFLPKLGNFMVEGAKRLLFGDPKRAERLSHIHQMEARLAAEKDKEAWLKSSAATCMKSEDPDACLRAMGGARYGVTHLPKMVQRPAAGTTLFGGEPGPSKIGGGFEQRTDYDIVADEVVRKKYGGVIPTDPDKLRQLQIEVEKEVQQRQAARNAAKEDARTRRQKDLVDYKMARAEARDAERDARREAAKNNVSVTESYPEWKDSQGNTYRLDELRAAQIMARHPNFYLVKGKVTTRRTYPAGRPPEPQPDVTKPQPEMQPKTELPEDPGEDLLGVPFLKPKAPAQEQPPAQ